ncbi:MAG TPA: hypothetical protein VIG24_17650 [Acidimicrobiia bacterium]
MTPLVAYAVSIHEMYDAFREAGFTDAQAMYLTAQRMTADARRN